MRDLAAEASQLRSFHRDGMLVLANAWDVPSARLVEEVGFPVVATSSSAIAALHGVPDSNVLGADAAFAAVKGISDAVSIPVTADIEAGYGLEPEAIVERLLAAGAVGCNFEDTDHHGDADLVPADQQAERIHALKEAGRSSGVDVVVNARVDVYLRGGEATPELLDEALRRGRLYREAGADSIYPIGVSDVDHIRALVDGLETINVLAVPGAPDLATLQALGVRRVSVGGGLFMLAHEHVRAAARRLRSGDEPWWSGWPQRDGR